MKKEILILSIALSSCSTHEVVTTEHKGKSVIVHHKHHEKHYMVDRIEAIDAKGAITQAEVKVYDVGRLPDGHGGMSEAHEEYRVVQDAHFNTNLPAKVTRGVRTVFTPPNYSPPPQDQRINDAVAEAQEAKNKLEETKGKIEKRLEQDNNLRGELQQVEDKNQVLQDQLNAAMSTPRKDAPKTDAQKAAEDAVNPLVLWGEKSK